MDESVMYGILGYTGSNNINNTKQQNFGLFKFKALTDDKVNMN